MSSPSPAPPATPTSKTRPEPSAHHALTSLPELPPDVSRDDRRELRQLPMNIRRRRCGEHALQQPTPIRGPMTPRERTRHGPLGITPSASQRRMIEIEPLHIVIIRRRGDDEQSTGLRTALIRQHRFGIRCAMRRVDLQRKAPPTAITVIEDGTHWTARTTATHTQQVIPVIHPRWFALSRDDVFDPHPPIADRLRVIPTAMLADALHAVSAQPKLVPMQSLANARRAVPGSPILGRMRPARRPLDAMHFAPTLCQTRRSRTFINPSHG